MIDPALQSSRGHRASAIAVSSVIAAVILCGCSAPTAMTPQSSPVASTPSSPAPTPATDDYAGMADPFEERDAFFAEQGFTGTGPLTATTDAQKALVKAQLKQLIVSSPLTPQLTPQDATPEQVALHERGIASMSVFSASYLCPVDADAWEAAFRAAYPG